MFIAVAVFGLATIVFGLSRSFPLSLAALWWWTGPIHKLDRRGG